MFCEVDGCEKFQGSSIFLQHFAYMVQLVYPFCVVCVGSIDQLSSQLAVRHVIPRFQNPLKNSNLIVKTKSLTCYAFQNTACINPQWVIPISGDMRVMVTVAACCRGSGLASTEVH
jgi:hypothetical protein